MTDMCVEKMKNEKKKKWKQISLKFDSKCLFSKNFIYFLFHFSPLMSITITF